MDTIGDMLIRLKNAQARKHYRVMMPFSNMKLNIANVLKAEGYIQDAKKIEKDKKPELEVILRYEDKMEPKITTVKRISKPGRRMYVKWDKIPKVLNGLGLAIISTPQGVMSDKEARKKKLGGEFICELY